MASFHQVINNALGTVQNSPNLAIGGTNLIVNAALDTILSALTFPFWVTLWGAGLNPTSDTAREIVEVTARPSPNNYTIGRAKQGTAASVHTLGDNVGLLWTLGNAQEVTPQGTVAQGALYYIGSDNLPHLLAPGTAGYVLSTNGAAADPSYIPFSNTTLVQSFQAIETCVSNASVYPVANTAAAFDPGVAVTDNLNWGDASARTQIAQSFQENPGYAFNQIKLTLAKVGAPVDTVTVAIQADSAGSPSGVDLSTATYTGGSITTSAVEYSLTLSSMVQCTASGKYWIVQRRSAAVSGSDFYRWFGKQTTNPYANGAQAYYNGSVWAVATNDDAEFKLFLTGPAVVIRNTRANVAGAYTPFIGFTSAAIASGASGNVITDGVAPGLSGLTVGSTYYLSDTFGAISTSPGTNSRKAGIAISTTALLITNIW